MAQHETNNGSMAFISQDPPNLDEHAPFAE